MIRVIDGTRYNTDTAEKIAEKDNGLYITDFNYRSATLYKTKKGKYFIYHEGGAATDIARLTEDGAYVYGEIIEPISEERAERIVSGKSTLF